MRYVFQNVKYLNGRYVIHIKFIKKILILNFNKKFYNKYVNLIVQK